MGRQRARVRGGDVLRNKTTNPEKLGNVGEIEQHGKAHICNLGSLERNGCLHAGMLKRLKHPVQL